MSKWESLKKRHKELSAAAAAEYDSIFQAANFATGSYMQYELDKVRELIPQASSVDLAVDLGCGTGRMSFEMARSFKQVFAYDISPEMIKVANSKKLQKLKGNVQFAVRDVELARLPQADSTVSFVNTGFGMGSFIEDLSSLFREVRRVLAPGGIAVFSFYSSEALVNSLDLEWKPALAARLGKTSDTLVVEFGKKSYEIAAKSYSLKQVKNRLKGMFRSLEIVTFPTLSALFPNKLFEDDRACKLCAAVDHLLSSNTELAAGPYIIAVGRKAGKPKRPEPARGYARVLELLKFYELTTEPITHEPVRTMEEVQSVLDVSPGKMVKSVLIAVENPEEKIQARLKANLFLCCVPANMKLNMRKVANVLKRSRSEIRLASQIEVEELTGFTTGSIPPFGMPDFVPVIVDSRLAALHHVWCGTGKATESLRLSIGELKKLSACTEADLAK